MADNSFNNTVESLFKGMDSFITTKTVVGDAIHIGDTIILPLVDVSFGVAAGAFSAEKKNNGAGGMGLVLETCSFGLTLQTTVWLPFAVGFMCTGYCESTTYFQMGTGMA